MKILISRQYSCVDSCESELITAEKELETLKKQNILLKATLDKALKVINHLDMHTHLTKEQAL